MTITTDVQNQADNLVMRIMLTPEGRANPYPLYRELRELTPLYRSSLGPVWFLSRYDDARTMLRDNRFGKSETDPRDRAGQSEEAGMAMLFGGGMDDIDVPDDMMRSRSLIGLNPPDHTRLRGLVARGFTPKRVEALRPAIEQMCRDVLDAVPSGEPVDVLDVLGFPLPVKVIGELVGVPSEDRDRFRPLVRTAAATLEPGVSREDVMAGIDAMGELRSYFASLIAQRRDDSRDDLTSVLVHASDDEGKLTEDEIIITLILVFAAGFETTTNLIGNGLLTLLENPTELDRLRADRSLMPLAVEEVLRFQSPVQLDARQALEDADIAGEPVAAGEWAVCFIGGANRDPAVYDDPESFTIRDRATPVLSFASGIHYCLGAALARMEGQIVFDQLLDRFASIELADAEPSWRNTLILRGLDHLHVTFA